MGFEQLAALKDQLAKQAAEKRAAKQATQAKHARPPRPAAASTASAASSQASEAGQPGQAAHVRHAARPKQTAPASQAKAGRSTPGANRGAPPQKSKPVDPVVLSIGKLQKRFPKAFPKNPAPKVPLKVGIFKDLLVHAEELGLNEAALRDAIKVWCWGSRYWACVADNAMRVDLNGEDAGQVLPAEAARARGLQAKRQKSRNAAQTGAAQPDGNALQQSKPVAQDGQADQHTVSPQGDHQGSDAGESSVAAAQADNDDSGAPDDSVVTQDSTAEQGNPVQ